MIGLVAIVVATVILVFFGIGYLLGRAFRGPARPRPPNTAFAAGYAGALAPPMGFAIFGIENDALNLAVNLLILFLVVIWLALVYWTYADARRRIADGLLVACATAASLFPFVGTVVYLIVRPPEYLDDVRERELEIAAAEARLAGMEHLELPALRLRGREGLSALPELPAPAQGAVQRLRQAARSALEDLPLLRGRGRPGAGRGPPDTAAPHRRRCGPGATGSAATGGSAGRPSARRRRRAASPAPSRERPPSAG